MSTPSLERIYWQDVRVEVAKVNPEMAEVIDGIDPGKEYPLYRAKYPFGTNLDEQGKFFVPVPDGKLLPIDDSYVPKHIQQDLRNRDNSLPTGMALNNYGELYMRQGDRILSRGIFKPGSLFSLWSKFDLGPAKETFHPLRMFNISAGARSMFMLPNLGDRGAHKHLVKDYNVRLPPPKRMLDEQEVFVQISQHSRAGCDWFFEVLLFSKSWDKAILENPAWKPLLQYLLHYLWMGTSYWRNQMLYNFAISVTQENRNLKANPYLVDTVKHLLSVIAGVVPGFEVSANDLAGPVSFLQKVYLESYGLKKYIPMLMQPSHFEFGHADSRPVYYSLQLPTTLEFSPKSRKLASAMSDLSELKHIMDVVLDEANRGRLNIEDTLLGRALMGCKIDFFHVIPDRHGEILLTKDIPAVDPNMLHQQSLFPGREFNDSATFFRGCVRILSQ